MCLAEFLRLTQGNRPIWVSPMLNAPFGLARSGDFVVTSAVDALLSGGFALVAGLALIAAMRFTRFGRRWRAYADDPLAAATVRRRARAPFSPRPLRWPAHSPASPAS